MQNDSWNAYQSAHTGRQVLPQEWRKAQQMLRMQKEKLEVKAG
jgi:hypothetical protein